jgi:cobalt/nickel transport system permease protein
VSAGSAGSAWYGPAAAASGWLQAIDGRLRVLAGLGGAMVTVSLHDLNLLLLALALAAGLAILARLSAGPTLRRLLAIDAFLIPVLLLLPFSVPGAPLITAGPFTASSAGVTEAARIIVTANAVMLMAAALIGTLEPTRLAAALRGLGIPQPMTAMLLLTIRYIAVLRDEYGRLRLAMKARAFCGAPALHRWRSIGFLFGMLLVRSFDRAERVLAAMKCRGYPGPAAVPASPPLGRADWAFASAMLIALSALGGCAWL